MGRVEDLLGAPPYEVCPNYGFEFGNDDNPCTVQPTTFEQYRAEWDGEGPPRFADQSRTLIGGSTRVAADPVTR